SVSTAPSPSSARSDVAIASRSKLAIQPRISRVTGEDMERRSPTPAAARKRKIIHLLKTALAEDRFVLHYQPIVSARDSRVRGVEALLRWRHPSRQDDNIEELIWSVERSPVIFRLENWILRQACHDTAAWQTAGLRGLRVNVNLSAREFPRADLVARVTRQIASCGLDP